MADGLLAERTPPHNLEAERSVLGVILLRNDAFDVAVEVIDADDFYRDAHRRIFEKMVRLTERGNAIDLVTLKEELGRSGEIDEVEAPRTLRRSSMACRGRPTSRSTRALSKRRPPSGR